MSDNSTSTEVTTPSTDREFTHYIQLQLADILGLPVCGTEFYVKLRVKKKGNRVKIYFPTINFQIGPVSQLDQVIPYGSYGYIYTSGCWLPEDVRPSNVVYQSVVAASNTGTVLSYTFLNIPSPPNGFILQITNYGGVIIQSTGIIGNIIPPGPQVMLPTTISYEIGSTIILKNNYPLALAPTDVTQFSKYNARNDALRDSHVNDAFNNVLAWSWTDNSTISDKTTNNINTFVAIGTTDKHGKLIVNTPIQLTNNPPGFFSWDTAVAINRTNPNNIIVSWLLIDFNNHTSHSYRAVSFDGGLTWPSEYNGKLPFPSAGDNRGVASDKYGNIWYSLNNGDDPSHTYPPLFYVSSDGGITFTFVFQGNPTAPDGSVIIINDYPQYCFGGDGQGNYGLWFSVDLFTNIAIYPYTGFIPIFGLGKFGTPFSFVNSVIPSVQYQGNLTASSDGRLWYQTVNILYTYVTPTSVIYKSVGPITDNYAGPFNIAIVNAIDAYASNLSLNITSHELSQPVAGYFPASVQSIIYDECRQALWATATDTSPNYPLGIQNMVLYLFVSRDNGLTWTDPLYISNTLCANRGFLSMALDTVTGNLVFGWYDGRCDPTFRTVIYTAAIITAETLDNIIKDIPVANPRFTIPGPVLPTSSSSASSSSPSSSPSSLLYKVPRIKDNITNPRVT